MKRTGRAITIAGLLSALALAGCGSSGDSGIFDVTGGTGFWAYNFETGSYYRIRANLAGGGAACRVYVEQGRTVALSVVDNIVAAFDNTIYPGVTSAFGSEPNPGIDGNPRITILLLDIRDGYDPVSSPSYIAGYFDPINEYSQGYLDANFPGERSNAQEMFYMDVSPAVPGSADFLNTLAHEFQHMIHFNQEEVSKNGAWDEPWLNEAMSEVAPVYCDFGPSYTRIDTFEGEPWNSLTVWGSRVEDYAVAYMWAQYVMDRIDPFSPGNTVFWRMLHNPLTGIPSVDSALAEISYGKDFAGVFKDWAVANYSGNRLSWPGAPEWSYVTIDTWPGTYPDGEGGTVTFPGLFADPGRTDQTALQVLEPWSVNYYRYNPADNNVSGTVAWTRGDPDGWAALADNVSVAFDLSSGSPASYDNVGYLIVANPSGSGASGGDTVVFTSLAPGPATASRILAGAAMEPASSSLAAQTRRPATPAEMLAAAGRNPSVRRIVATTGRPFPVCVHPFLKEAVRPLKEKGIRPFR